MTSAPYTLVLLRHGESEWNAKNLFTGWVDVPSPRRARPRPRAAGGCSPRPACCPTCCTPRCCAGRSRTAHLALDACDRHWIPVRAVLAAQRAALRRAAGQGQEGRPSRSTARSSSCCWRRSYDVPPPPIADDDEFASPATRGTPTSPDEILPRTECLADVVARMLPYWYDAIVPDLRTGRTVCVAAHGNSLRALVKHLDGISDEADRRAQHPDRHPAGLPARRATCARPGRRRVPRPGRGGRRDRGGREPGPLSRLDPVSGSRAGVHRWSTAVTRLAGDQVDHPAGQRDGVVGDPLVVAAEQGDVDGRLDAVRPGVVEHQPERASGAAGPSPSSSSSSWRAPSTSRSAMIPATVPTIFSATVAIRWMVGTISAGTADLGHPQPRDLGDVHRQVAHPLEVGHHPQRRDEHPQVAGDRLLEGEQLEGRAPRPARGRRRWRRRRR